MKPISWINNTRYLTSTYLEYSYNSNFNQSNKLPMAAVIQEDLLMRKMKKNGIKESYDNELETKPTLE